MIPSRGLYLSIPGFSGSNWYKYLGSRWPEKKGFLRRNGPAELYQLLPLKPGIDSLLNKKNRNKYIKIL
jgi:hypothetical protein